MKQKRALLFDDLNTFIFFGFTLAQPLFDLLSNNAEFFVARHAEPVDVIILILFMCILCPSLIVLMGVALGTLGHQVRRGFHFIVVTTLAVGFVLPILKRLPETSGIAVVTVAVVFGLLFSGMYMRFRPIRVNLTFLSPAILVFPALFFFDSSIFQFIFPGKEASAFKVEVNNPAPVVMVVFDEFPVTSLMDEDRRIDPVRYPNFAALAKDSYWFRNATTVSENTLIAVPSILTGLYPTAEENIPTSSRHPNQLFTLLGGSYRMKVYESLTELCASELCKKEEQATLARRVHSMLSDLGIIYLHILLPQDLSNSLPDITTSWKSFGEQADNNNEAGIEALDKLPSWDRLWGKIDWKDRPQNLIRFVNSLDSNDDKTLFFLHVILPHSNWEYLPSGKRHSLSKSSKIRGAIGINSKGSDPHKWTDDQWAITQMFQRHLLQVGLVDRLVGELVNRLKSLDLYDKSLIVITADHGISFQPETTRRHPTKKNYYDIMAIPLFIKVPHQKEGVISDRNVETIDILPTIADILGINLPWKIDGQSALDLNLPERTYKTIYDNDANKMVVEARIENKYRTLKRKTDLFGSRSIEKLFSVGTNNSLVGKRVIELDIEKERSIEVKLDNEVFYTNLDMSGPFIPANITGQVITNQDNNIPFNLAIAVNGTIRAVTETFVVDSQVRFSALVSESSFNEGLNKVDIFFVYDDKRTTLHRATQIDDFNYQFESTVLFGNAGNAAQYQESGWSKPEKGFTWTNSKSATILLKLTEPSASVSLKANINAYLSPGKIDKQTVEIMVNGQKAGEWVITEKGFHTETIQISKELLTKSVYTLITFSLPNAISPAAVGTNKDERILGLAFNTLVLSEKKENGREL